MEMTRTITMGLPFNISKSRVKDLARYVISQINIRRTLALNDNVAPRVKFTGVGPDFYKECSLAFGDYVEAYNPRAESGSNNVLISCTEC
jgi:hypothetical protein